MRTGTLGREVILPGVETRKHLTRPPRRRVASESPAVHQGMHRPVAQAKQIPVARLKLVPGSAHRGDDAGDLSL